MSPFSPTANEDINPIFLGPADKFGFRFRVKSVEERDALEAEELNRDRIRQILRRYGVVFRARASLDAAPRTGRRSRSSDYCPPVLIVDTLRGLI